MENYKLKKSAAAFAPVAAAVIEARARRCDALNPAKHWIAGSSRPPGTIARRTAVNQKTKGVTMVDVSEQASINDDECAQALQPPPRPRVLFRLIRHKHKAYACKPRS